MKIHLDKWRYNQKPPKNDIGQIKSATQSAKNIVDLPIEEILKAIQQGRTVSPAVLIGGCKGINWTEQSLWMVDLDNDKSQILTMDNALEICKSNKLEPAFAYYSFSHSESKPKFRLGFVMDEIITDTYKRKAIIETLTGLFGDSVDLSARNADRIFFGTNKGIAYKNLDARITFKDIIGAYKPPIDKNIGGDNELSILKKEFDFLGYLTERFDVAYEGDNYISFHDCYCGHKNCLVFYPETNSFKCFSSNGGAGGSIVDFLMAQEKLSVRDAIEKFKHDIMLLPRVDESDLVKQLKDIKPCGKYATNDRWMGELYAVIFKNDCRFNATTNSWYTFNGKVWSEDSGGMIVQNLAKKLYDSLLKYATSIPDDSQRQNYISGLLKYGSLGKRDLMIKDARDKYYITQKDLDKNEHLFNCQNGTYDLNTGEFRPHNSDDLLSKISNVVYDPNAKSNEWEKFINEIMQNDKSKIEYLQKILGYALTTDTSLETAFIFWGSTTRNGKSSLVEVVSHLMGGSDGYSMGITPQTLAQKDSSDSRRASGDIARLDGCRFLNASEPNKSMKFDASLLKTLLGRDTIIARHLHCREFEFIPKFKLFINCNFLPVITDNTLFASGRLQVLTFDRHFTESEQDKGLKHRLKNERNISGIFNWLLEGLKKFRSDGLVIPDAVKQATDEYRGQSDKLGTYIKERLVYTGNNTKASDVFNDYNLWCLGNEMGSPFKSTFYDELKTKGLFASHGTIDGKTAINIVKGYEIVGNVKNINSICKYI